MFVSNINTKTLLPKAKRLYVETMFQVVGRAMQAISETDEIIKKESLLVPEGFVFEMTVLPGGPGFVVRKTASGHFEYLGSDAQGKADLSIAFKHLTHAFLVFSFQESTSLAFSHDRMLVDGDVALALRMTRILNRLESFILPKLFAERAVKEYPQNLRLPDKLLKGARIYLQMATNLVTAR